MLEQSDVIDIGIIGGTGLLQLQSLALREQRQIETLYGKTSAAVSIGTLASSQRVLAFLPRHGSNHHLAPHQVNYRANISALHQLGVKRIIAVNAVGGIDPTLNNGDIVLPDQLIDYTYSREHTFCSHESVALQHIDFTHPFSATLRQQLIQAAERAAMPIVNSGCTAVTQGPRLETAAEIKKMAKDGCTIVGMTTMPEAALARELAIDYASIALVVNPAAGVSDTLISMQQIQQVIDSGMSQVLILLEHFIQYQKRHSDG